MRKPVRNIIRRSPSFRRFLRECYKRTISDASVEGAALAVHVDYTNHKQYCCIILMPVESRYRSLLIEDIRAAGFSDDHDRVGAYRGEFVIFLRRVNGKTACFALI